MMNAYDAANQLAQALKESHEHKKLNEAKNLLETDADAQKMVKDFLKKQTELQVEALSGKEISPAKQEQLQKLCELVAQTGKGRDYLQAYPRFQLMMEDVYKILGEAAKPVLGDGQDE
jgi:cell fate (sporulation/competence/biofilm development) regulator YlbF (YheA/YmcA/DUF963 family)